MKYHPLLDALFDFCETVVRNGYDPPTRIEVSPDTYYWLVREAAPQAQHLMFHTIFPTGIQFAGPFGNITITVERTEWQRRKDSAREFAKARKDT